MTFVDAVDCSVNLLEEDINLTDAGEQPPALATERIVVGLPGVTVVIDFDDIAARDLEDGTRSILEHRLRSTVTGTGA